MKLKLGKHEIHIPKDILVISIIVVIISLISYTFFVYNDNPDIIIDSSQSTPVSTPPSSEPKDDNKSLIQVYIVGEVKNEGIYTVDKGSLLNTIIDKAGGITSNADKKSINMVYTIDDNCMITIKSKKEISNSMLENSDATGKGVVVSSDIGKGVDIVSKNNQNSVVDKGTKSSSGKVNINTASKTQLETLPGIGTVTASKIITYREQNGSFSKPEDIKKVSGLGDAKYSAIKDLITVK